MKILQPEWQARLHAGLTVFWMLMTIPALIWWKESILYVVLISQWANVAAHWASFQGAHAEKRTKEQSE